MTALIKKFGKIKFEYLYEVDVLSLKKKYQNR